ncbi:MAG TPA: phytanoyl-CoA dioxygenase family protein [Planctomycetaceae bacterium]|nr:phytanoyl-CoA dioxygenase family protein [Planctomycetaceae bacterium]
MSTKEYRIIPQDEELARQQRDLQFRPADPARARVLTSQQVADYNQSGYVRRFRAYDPEQILAIRQYFDRLLEKTVAAGGNSYSISTAHLKYGGVYDILTNPVIVDRVADLLGDDVVAWGSHFFCKMPGDGKAVAWHQDASYWPLSPSHAVTVWLAIDDADLENGCMKFIAGSHHSGHLTYRRSSPEEHNVLDQTVENAESFGSVVVDDLQAGEASIHNDLLLHGSDPNSSTRRRCALTLRYAAAAVRAGSGWNEKGVVVRGQDPSGHWANPARPTVE